jgi:pimeloyl-ACP methyl ester carboxylesterase
MMRTLSLLAALALLAPVPATAQAPTAAEASAPRVQHMVELERSTVLVIEPSGPSKGDVVFIPGLSSPRDVWFDTVAAMDAGYRVHLVQIRGFGDAAGPNANGDVLAPFIVELGAYLQSDIVAKGYGKPAIVGHSLGGLSALTLAARNPELVGRVMVVDAVPFIGTIFGFQTVKDAQMVAKQMSDGMRMSYDATTPPPTKPDCSAMTGPAARLMGNMTNSAKGVCLVPYWTANSDTRVVAQALYDDIMLDMRPHLPNITAPVTLLYAQDDRLLGVDAARQAFEPQYAGTPNFIARMIPYSMHFIMLDQPDMFRAELDRFLLAP